MELVKELLTYSVATESEACGLIEQFRQDQTKDGYTIGKNGYVSKTKVDKKTGDLIEEKYLVTVEKKYDV